MQFPSYLNNGGELEYFKYDPWSEDNCMYIDGSSSDLDATDFFDKVDTIFQRHACPYCKEPVSRFYHQHDEDRYEFDTGLNDYSIEIKLCNWCFYWCYRRRIWVEGFGITGPIHSLALAKAATYQDVETECSKELSRYLRQRVELWHDISSKRVEKLVADVFRVHYPETEVIHVGRPADGGKDVILIETDGTKSLIEVKARQMPNHVEPVTTLRNLLGAMVGGEDKALKGIVVSTGHHFSYQAKKFAGGLSETAYSIELTDRGKLTRMLSPLASTERFMEAVNFDGSNSDLEAVIKAKLFSER